MPGNAGDVWKDILKGHAEATPGPQEGHTEATQGPQAGHEQATGETAEGKQSAANIRKIRLSDPDWDRLGVLAEREGTSRGAIVRRLVREYLRRQ